MKYEKWTLIVFAIIGLLIGGVVGGLILGGQPGRALAAPSAQTTNPCVEDDDSAEGADTEELDNDDEEVECGPQDEDEADEASEGPEAEDGNEDAAGDTSDEGAPTSTAISADQAQTIAEEANPNVATLAVEFDREGGHDIWEVELDNGMDVKVDANTGQILLTETRD